MLVHAATAPNAVLRALPAVPPPLWQPSLAAAWAATAAVTAAYAPVEARALPPAAGPELGEAMARALDTGDAHAIKFIDTLSDAYARSGDPVLRAVAARSVEQIAAD
ncbi:hypothetical protein PVK74_14915 [Micromonospora chalcea]|nr:hypothetical protein [Micromonospora chalcea]WDP97230.1 hypothetical protein PVK74_14915 [Micromonospora chalcea]